MIEVLVLLLHFFCFFRLKLFNFFGLINDIHICIFNQSLSHFHFHLFIVRLDYISQTEVLSNTHRIWTARRIFKETTSVHGPLRAVSKGYVVRWTNTALDLFHGKRFCIICSIKTELMVLCLNWHWNGGCLLDIAISIQGRNWPNTLLLMKPKKSWP